jgi:predicted ester cyclase
MSVEQNINVMERCFKEMWNEGNLDALPELVSDRYVSYSTEQGETGRGLAAFEKNVKNWRAAIPDLHLAVDSVAGAGDWLETRLTLTGTVSGGLGNGGATGKPIYHRFYLFSRYMDGKCVEATTCSDSASLAIKTGLLNPQI